MSNSDVKTLTPEEALSNAKKHRKPKPKQKKKTVKKLTEALPAKRPAHRPSQYSPELVQSLLDYFENYPKWEKIKIGSKMQTFPNPMPTISGWFRSIGWMTRDTFFRYVKENKEFSDAWDQCKEIQKEFLIYHGLTGRYQPQFAKFVAINFTDMRDNVVHQIDPNANTFKLNYNLEDE